MSNKEKHPPRESGPQEEQPHKGVSRRSFLKSAGLATAGTASIGFLEDLSAQVSAAAAPQIKAAGPGPVTLRINGKDQQLNIEPRTTLAVALRDHLHMTGTKIVCDRGSCSACTVMLDKTPVCSCMTLALDAVGRDVTTVEALGHDQTLHPVQAAFIEHDALQCGFCTPGMVMSTAHLFETNPSPSEADIKTAISGNICRCGTYPKVIAASLAASRGNKTEAQGA